MLYIVVVGVMLDIGWFFFFQAEDGIRDLVRSRGLGDVYKRQPQHYLVGDVDLVAVRIDDEPTVLYGRCLHRGALMGDATIVGCLLYTSPSPRDRTRSRMPSSA